MSLTPKLLQQGAAGSARPVYIEDVFSAFLYTGNGGTQTITNGIDLSTKGGLVWTKLRSGTASNNIIDTARGRDKVLYSDSTLAQQTSPGAGDDLTSFNTNGFSIGSNYNCSININGSTYVSWTFRKQAKFFDVVTYTGTSADQTINHNLDADVGFIIIKSTSESRSWWVSHRSLNGGTNWWQYNLLLNSTAAAATETFYAFMSEPTDTSFTVRGGKSEVNANGQTYVAYLFAHNAGGFGLTGTDNVISCGGYTGNGAAGGQLINLGYEAQWVMIKETGSTGGWWMVDIMRGYQNSTSDFGGDASFDANTSAAEANQVIGHPSALGFTPVQDNVNQSGRTYIYIAIRKGPMKVPTVGTSVFVAETYNGNNTLNREFSVAPVQYSDLSWFISRNYPTAPVGISFVDRLRGSLAKLWTGGDSNESTSQASVSFSNKMGSIVIGTNGNFSGLNETGTSFVMYNLKRAPGFFDEVCYTGNGTTQNLSHNLAAVPELMIVKARSLANRSWAVYFGNNGQAMSLNNTTAARAFAGWNYTTPTSSVFSVGADSDVNSSGQTYLAYLFATCPGVSKVGTYTGNGSTQTIDCGFAAGARFVLIKRTNSTGDWYTFDTARGIVSGNDPFLKINSTSAEETAYDAVDPTSAGFIVNNDATNFPINVASATYIFLAIA
jgi:hypothetical protein